MSKELLVHNGRQYVRASSIASSLSSFASICPKVLERKAAIGTDVHNAIHGDITEDFYPPNPEGVGYFTSYHRWREAVEPAFVQSETRYFSDSKRLTGCIDALIQMGGDKPILIDFKTSANEQPASWTAQAHLYYFLLSEAGIAVAPRFLFLQLNKNGALPIAHEYSLDQRCLRDVLRRVDDFWSSYEASSTSVST